MDEELRAEATNKNTPLTRLQHLAQEYPPLRPLIASNPSTYPALLQWLGELGDAEVTAALAARTKATESTETPENTELPENTEPQESTDVPDTVKTPETAATKPHQEGTINAAVIAAGAAGAAGAIVTGAPAIAAAGKETTPIAGSTATGQLGAGTTDNGAAGKATVYSSVRNRMLMGAIAAMSVVAILLALAWVLRENQQSTSAPARTPVAVSNNSVPKQSPATGTTKDTDSIKVTTSTGDAGGDAGKDKDQENSAASSDNEAAKNVNEKTSPSANRTKSENTTDSSAAATNSTGDDAAKEKTPATAPTETTTADKNSAEQKKSTPPPGTPITAPPGAHTVSNFVTADGNILCTLSATALSCVANKPAFDQACSSRPATSAYRLTVGANHKFGVGCTAQHNGGAAAMLSPGASAAANVFACTATGKDSVKCWNTNSGEGFTLGANSANRWNQGNTLPD